MHCGLDFGTSNSTLGTVGSDGTPHLAPLEGGNATIPSAIFFDFENDATLFGRRAQTAYVGGGVRYYLTRRFFLRAEYKSHEVFTKRNANEQVDEWKLGFAFFF